MARPAPQTDRLVMLVDLLASRPQEGFTLSEIARRLGVSLATCHPMLAVLTRSGWLVRHPTRKTYRLGPALVVAGQAAATGFPALDFAHPAMIELGRDLGLACLALAPGEDHATLVDMARDPRVPGPAMRIGDQTPFHPPLGVSFMAWADERVVQRWLGRGPSDARTRERYRRVLAATRERGFGVELATVPEARVRDALAQLDDRIGDGDAASATRLRSLLEQLAGELADHEEFLPVDLDGSRTYSLSSIAAPVFDGSGDVALLLTLRGFERPLDGARVVAIGHRLTDATNAITASTGGRHPDDLLARTR